MEIPEQDVAHMARAVELAGRGHGSTTPNPVVGCVVLDAAGQVAGEGYHAYAGGPHAEVVALAQAGERARGGTAYVTLEPCDHTGRTGPCSRALLDAGVARVVIAVSDPNPTAAGGAARLRAHGVSVTTGVLTEAAERVNEEWLTFMRLGRSHVTWKFAATLDGRSAAEDGTSKWITSPEARADVHRMRAASDAIVAGIGTVLADDPMLDVRAVETPRQPVRAVLDTQFVLGEQARIINGDPVWVFTTRPDAGKAARLAARNVRVIVLPADEYGGLSLQALVRWLGDHEINEVHVEAGARLQGALVQARLVDEWVSYLAPSVLGDGQSLAALPTPVASLDQAYRYEFLDVLQLGRDMRLRLRDPARWQALVEACGLKIG